MDFVSQLIFVGALLFLASILSTIITPRLGAPLLLVFLIVGLLAGEDGPGGIAFSDYRLANLLATAALAVILFDGGMRTTLASFKLAMKPALSLATVGVLITMVVTGAAAAYLLKLSVAEGLLIGAIVASTDAAAVFSLLSTQALSLHRRVGAMLEIESGTNDPMGVFLTLGLVTYIQTPQQFDTAKCLLFFMQQMGLGVLIGWGGGRLLQLALNRLVLQESLYPLLAVFGALLIFGFTATLGGSGFLAVYLAGLLLGNRRFVSQTAVRRFLDGIAWMAQIGMFLVLGLLATPHRLWAIALPALLIAAVQILLARPLAVAVSLAPFRMNIRERAYLAWVGLRGSVPVLLATYPLLAGVPNARLIFDVVFVLVLASLVVQGWTVAPIARWLRLEVPVTTEPVQRSEIDLPNQRGYELVSYRLGAESAVLGKEPKHLPLPDVARVVCVVREGKLLPYRAWGKLRLRDTVSVLAHERELPIFDAVFAAPTAVHQRAAQRFFGEFELRPDAPLAAINEAYDLGLRGVEKDTLEEYLHRVLPSPVVGDRLKLGVCEMVIKAVNGAYVTRVGLRLPHSPEK